MEVKTATVMIANRMVVDLSGRFFICPP